MVNRGEPASGVEKSASLPQKSPGQLGQVDPPKTGPKCQNQWALGSQVTLGRLKSHLPGP
jgi:hypothetical protein